MMFRVSIVFVLAAGLVSGQMVSAEASLEAAIHTETVVGDLKSALDQYQKIMAQSGNNRPVAARALLGVAQCQEKLGQIAAARVAFASVVQQYSDQTEIVAQARTKMTALANAGGPLNLGFQNGIGAHGSDSGWFIPQSLLDAGYSAEVRHQGCHDSSACAVVIASTTPKDGMFGNVMQGFHAAPYRGKTVRLRASLKLESADPGDTAQMWLRVDRPNRTPGAFDNMDDRPVRSAAWTPGEIVAKIADDAEFVNIGVTSHGKGRAWVDGMTFEVIAGDSKETGMVEGAAPNNLDFQKGTPGAVPTGWGAIKGQGYSAELADAGCRGTGRCAVVTGSATPGRLRFGNLMQSFQADAYRGKTVRLRAWLKMEAVDPNDAAQMWFRVDSPNAKVTAFDNMQDRPVQTAEWKLVEIVGKVGADAQLINFGVMSVGKGRAWVDGISFDVVPNDTPVTGSGGLADAPRNLDFSQGVAGAVPTGWFGVRTQGYSVELRRSPGCAAGPACAVVMGSATPQPRMFGNMAQSFSAVAYRGKTVRFRARLRLESVGPDDSGHLWLRVDLPNNKMGFFDNMDDRPMQAAEWTECEIVGKIDPAAETINFGVMSYGKGQVWVDAVSFEVVPDSMPQTGSRQH
jgi:hypothetical protein